MRKITSVVVSNIFDLVASAILGAIITLIIFSIYHLNAKEISGNPEIFKIFLSVHRGLHFLLNSVGGVVSIFAGVIGAKIAKEKYLLFGGLSSIACFISGIFSITRNGITVLTITLVVLTPLFGVLGGFIYLKAKRSI